MSLLHELWLSRLVLAEPRYSAESDDPVEQVKATLSWRLTAPIRLAKAMRLEFSLIRRARVVGPAAVESRTVRLRARVEAVIPHLLDSVPAPGTSTVSLLRQLVEVVTREGDDELWLLYTAVAGAFPDADTFLALRRRLEITPPRRRVRVVLEFAVQGMQRAHTHYRLLDIRTGGVVIDVNYCATRGFMSGVQRVVRETLKRWTGHSGVSYVGWDVPGFSMRPLERREVARVVAWDRSQQHVIDMQPAARTATTVVPWKCEVFLPEIAHGRFASRLTCLARFSGNRVSAIGYDTIPATDGFFVSREQSEDFAAYLTLLKHIDEVFAISGAVGEEFRGFIDALDAQGLSGPKVTVIPLSEDFPGGLTEEHHGDTAPTSSEPPLVLAVGGHEIRKNHVTIAGAAEKLWREGHRFSLLFAGGPGPSWYNDLDDRVTDLVLKGRSVAIVEGISDEELQRAYRKARVQVFVSLHEGFGLPVVEALAAGTPVITSNRGSMGELARNGGCVAVDPNDVDQLADVLRQLLTDEAALTRLTEEIGRRPRVTWDDYASVLWARVTGGRDGDQD